MRQIASLLQQLGLDNNRKGTRGESPLDRAIAKLKTTEAKVLQDLDTSVNA